MSTVTSVPLAEYLETSYRPGCDYLDGELLSQSDGMREMQERIDNYLHFALR